MDEYCNEVSLLQLNPNDSIWSLLLQQTGQEIRTYNTIYTISYHHYMVLYFYPESLSIYRLPKQPLLRLRPVQCPVLCTCKTNKNGSFKLLNHSFTTEKITSSLHFLRVKQFTKIKTVICEGKLYVFIYFFVICFSLAALFILRNPMQLYGKTCHRIRVQHIQLHTIPNTEQRND